MTSNTVTRTTIDQHDLLFRNMDANEVLSESISFFIRHFGLIAGVVLLAGLPLFVWQFLWLQQPGEWGSPVVYHSARDLANIAGLANAIVVNGNMNGMLIAGVMVGAYVSLVRGGALAFALSESYLGRKVTPAQAVGAAISKFTRLLIGHGCIALLIVLIALAVPKLPLNEFESWAFAAIMLAIVPRFLLITQTIMIEDVSGVDGIRRSLGLVSGRFWFVFVIWIVVEIVLGLLSLVPAFALGLAQTALAGRNEMIARVLIPSLAMLFIDPLFDVALVFVYYQLRRRKERFDGKA